MNKDADSKTTGEQARLREQLRSGPRARPHPVPAPGPGQESVWDYPRPPRLEFSSRRVLVRLAGATLARSLRPLRVCETAGPPVYYVPLRDVRPGVLQATERETFCEWKGVARYWNAVVGAVCVPFAAWSYPRPDAPYEALQGAVAFYPGRVTCLLDGERVRPQPGDFYGGWVSDDVVGPFKGTPGTEHW